MRAIRYSRPVGRPCVMDGETDFALMGLGR